jgi:hypothetical protein
MERQRRRWVPIRGHFKWDVAGITHRKDGTDKPWRVKVMRGSKSINVGHYASLRKAQAAAQAFRDQEVSV